MNKSKNSKAELAPTIPFIEASKALEKITDLEALLQQFITRDAQRWGLINLFKKHGAIKNAGNFEAMFSNLTIVKKNIPLIEEKIKKEGWIPIFIPKLDPKKLNAGHIFTTLFITSKIPCYYADFDPAIVRRIDLKNIPDVTKFPQKKWLEQLALWKAEYKKIKKNDSTYDSHEARVIFTNPNIKITKKEKSTTFEDIHLATLGKANYIDPVADFFLKRKQIDIGLEKIVGSEKFNNLNQQQYDDLLKNGFKKGKIYQYLPKEQILTRYPLYILPEGHVPLSQWSPDSHQFGLDHCLPDIKINYIRSQVVLS